MTNQSEKEALFTDLLERYDNVVRRICFMYSGPSAQFDDLYQESMLNIWRGLDSFRGDSSIITWIYRATVNSCLSWLRYNKRHTSHTSLDDALTMVAGEDSSSREQLLMVYDLISALDPLQKAIIMMWLDGHSYDEIAGVTGLTRENVAVRLHRIKNKLKENCQK